MKQETKYDFGTVITFSSTAEDVIQLGGASSATNKRDYNEGSRTIQTLTLP